MSAPLVVEGGNGKYEGTLFGGLKFWVSLQVPLRNFYIEKLKNNGAKLVQLEKFADVLIADQLKKVVPANSVSYKFIDKCIAEGEIVDIEEFRVSKGSTARPVASTQPTSAARTKFSPAEDQILVSWVRKQEEAGESVKGNEIYKELARQYPNRTWQSWQARWIKNLSYTAEKDLPTTIDLSKPPEMPVADPFHRATQKSPPAPTQGTRARVPFTSEDDKLIFEYVQERIRQGVKEKGNVIYQEFEEQHPHHTAQSWRDRYLKYLANRDPNSFYDQPGESKQPLQPRPPPRPSAPASTSPPTLPSATRATRRPTTTQSPPKQPPSSSRANSRVKSSTPAPSKPGESRAERLRRITSAKKIQRAWSRYTLRRTLARRHALRLKEHALSQRSSSPLQKKFPLIRVERDVEGGGVKFSYPTEGDNNIVMDPRPRQPFHRSEEALGIFLRLVQGTSEIVEEFELDLGVRKKTKKVNLFELWRLVLEEHELSSGMGEMEWLKVADKLGFFSNDDDDDDADDNDNDDGIDDHERVGLELKAAFRRYGLLEAWEAMGVFEEWEWEGFELGG